jgi:hypothetical protein
MSLVRSVSGEKILGRYVLVRSVTGPICLKNLGRSVHISGRSVRAEVSIFRAEVSILRAEVSIFRAEASGPKRLWAEVALVRSVFGPKCLTFVYYLP